MNKSIMAIVCSGALLTGCAQAGGAKSDEAVGTNRPAATSASASETTNDTSPELETETTEPEPEPQSTELKFGETFTWEDGLSVTVGKPKTVNKTEWAAGGEDSKYWLVFPVTIVNKTGKPFDAAVWSSSLQAGNEEGEAIFDSENGYNETPSTKIRDGREAKFKVAYGVNDKSDLVMDVAPDWEHEEVTYLLK